MTETTELLETPDTGAKRRGPGLAGMVLPDLKALAGELGIKGTSGMRKGDLIAAIAERQSGGGAADRKNDSRPSKVNGNQTKHSDATNAQPPLPAAVETSAGVSAGESEQKGHDQNGGRPDGGHVERGTDTTSPSSSNGSSSSNASTNTAAPVSQESGDQSAVRQDGTDGQNPDGQGGDEFPSRERSNRRNRRNRRDRPDGATGPPAGASTADVVEATDNGQGNGAPTTSSGAQTTVQSSQGGSQNSGGQNAGSQNAGSQNSGSQNSGQRDYQGAGGQNRQNTARNQGGQNQGGQNRDNQNRDNQNRGNQNQGNQNRDNLADDDLDENGSRRGRRYRDRNRRGRERFVDSPTDVEVRDDDVLLPVAGILDVLDSYAFVRTSGYLTGSNDVYVSLSQVRKYGLRRGDAVTGAVRAPRDGEAARQKFNALVRLDSINGLDPEQARNRPEFTKLTPLYPNERLRLETEANILTTRVIDLVMPVGKGQRALIVSPPKAGKTSVLQAIANAISTNNPECHLMVVLVDERPEEVTDMQRSVKGEVIASTFDRPPADHTQLAELAIERAKRLVEMGRDVVVLLDSITRLGRAYNLAAPASGRILSGGVDSTALFPPKRFLGAARNIENGGSLTIFASALVETGSAGDTVIFEEFKGTGNAELKLDRRIADKRVFPAIDIDQSSTRKEDLLMSPEEHAVILKLRRVLGALDSQQSLDLVLDRLRKTRSNVEFLMQVAQTTPGGNNNND